MDQGDLSRECKKGHLGIGLTLTAFLIYNSFDLFAGEFFALNRPLFNIDYFFPIAFFAIRKWNLAFLFLIFIAATDLATTIFPQFQDPVNLLRIKNTIGFLNGLSTRVISAIIFFLIVKLVVAAQLGRWQFQVRAWSQMTSIAALLVVISLGDLVNGSSKYANFGHARISKNIAFSSSSKFLSKILNGISFIKSGETNTLILTQSAFSIYSHLRTQDGIKGKPKAQSPRQTLFMMVESFGVFQNSNRQTMLVEHLNIDSNRYSTLVGTIDFSGNTLDAEAREFFGVAKSIQMQKLNKESSIIYSLRNSGTQTFAFHNFYSVMYERDDLYAAIGFQNRFFLEDIEEMGDKNREYAGIFFRGPTDRSVSSEIRKVLERPIPIAGRFVYWLTLSSHLPVDRRFAKTLKPMDSRLGLAIDPPIEEHTRIVAEVLSCVGNIASSAKIGICDIVICGDHPPPFEAKLFGKYYISGKIPYVMLINRSTE